MSRFDARGNATLLTVLAVALIGGFMYWLYWRAQNLETSFQAAPQDTAAEQVMTSVDSLTPDSAGGIAGRRVLFDSALVEQGLGRGVFTLRLDDTTSYPVLMNPSLIQRQTEMYGGDEVLVGGRIYTLNDSIQASWVESGAVDSSMADAVPASATFLLADTLTLGS
jgi:hypothetical protein